MTDTPGEAANLHQSTGPQEGAHLTRRGFIKGASALGASGLVVVAGLAGYEKHERTGWPESFNNDIPIDPDAGDKFARIEDYTPRFTSESVQVNEQYERAMIDPRYLKWLFEQLRNANPELGNGEAIYSNHCV